MKFTHIILLAITLGIIATGSMNAAEEPIKTTPSWYESTEGTRYDIKAITKVTDDDVQAGRGVTTIIIRRGSKMIMNVPLAATPQEIKEIILDAMSIPIKMQKLVWQGQELDEPLTKTMLTENAGQEVYIELQLVFPRAPKRPIAPDGRTDLNIVKEKVEKS